MNIYISPADGKKGSTLKYLKKNYDLYLILIPGILFLIIFKYIPLYGITIAFKDFDLFAGKNAFDSIIKSPWVGFDNFEKIFGRPEFFQVLSNTLIISIYKIIFLFPLPIILAILINEIGNKYFKKGIQTLLYLPHFLSWVIVSGLFVSILSIDGVVNKALGLLGIEPVRFFMDNSIFRGLLIVTAGWKESGWSAIIYLAAIVSIDVQLYEAAIVDGANKFQQILYVTIPGISPTIVLMFILRVGHILEAGFEQILVLYNPTVYKVADIIQTYVYRIGLGQMDFSLGSVVGLFDSVVAFILIVSANYVCRRTLDRSIW